MTKWGIFQLTNTAIEENKVVHLIGFSMGAMIASIVASRYQIATLALLSPAVYVLTPHVLRMRLETLFQLNKNNRSLSEHMILNDRSFFRFIPINNLFQFQRVVRHAKRIFQHISIPICIIHGQKDETVDPKSSKLIYREVSSKEKELHYLPFSRHHICRGRDVNTVIQMIVEFLKKYNRNQFV